MTAQDNEARLTQLRAERAELAKARAARESGAAEKEQLEAEERALRDEQAIDAAETEHGPAGRKIAIVETDLGVVIVKRANALLFRRFMDQGSTKHVELEKLVRPSLVHPDGAAFDRILDAQPAVLMRCADAIAKLAGVRAEEAAGKS